MNEKPLVRLFLRKIKYNRGTVDEITEKPCGWVIINHYFT